jgi:hypothetical protein
MVVINQLSSIAYAATRHLTVQLPHQHANTHPHMGFQRYQRDATHSPIGEALGPNTDAGVNWLIA